MELMQIYLNLEELVEINFFRDIYKKYKKKLNKQNYKIATYQIIRDSIDLMIKDLINNTKNNLINNKIKSLKILIKTSFLMVKIFLIKLKILKMK